jgi:uncharacterized membrane protein YdjX (TVP38/TMEM64 family)
MMSYVSAVFSLLHIFAISHPIGAVVGFLFARVMCVVYPPAPGLPTDLAAIGLFGLVRGFALAELGIMLGATIAFLVARHARESAGVSTRRSRLSVLAARIARSVDDDGPQQFYAWFVIRLRTNPLFDPLSYAAGLSSARFSPFFLGTLLGNMPSIALFFVAEYFAIAAGTWTFVASTVLFGLTIWYFATRWLAESESFVA